MDYQNQLILTGAIDSNTGEPLRASSGNSYRLGLEIDADISLTESFSVRQNIAVSQNKNVDFFTNRDNAITRIRKYNYC